MKLGRSRHVKTKARCPNCDKKLDGATGVIVDGKDTAPAPGDITVCAYCQIVLVFDEKLMMRLPTFSEMDELAHDPRVIAIKPVLKMVFPKSPR